MDILDSHETMFTCSSSETGECWQGKQVLDDAAAGCLQPISIKLKWACCSSLHIFSKTQKLQHISKCNKYFEGSHKLSELVKVMILPTFPHFPSCLVLMQVPMCPHSHPACLYFVSDRPAGFTLWPARHSCGHKQLVGRMRRRKMSSFPFRPLVSMKKWKTSKTVNAGDKNSAFLSTHWCLQRLALVTSCCLGVGQPCDE